jgi:hypothetical protein
LLHYVTYLVQMEIVYAQNNKQIFKKSKD